MRRLIPSLFAPALFALAALLVGAPSIASADPIEVIVVIEGGPDAATARPHVDRVVSEAARRAGWPEARGRYFDSKKTAKGYIDKSKKPSFGFLSFGTYLGMRKAHSMTVIGAGGAAGGVPQVVVVDFSPSGTPGKARLVSALGALCGATGDACAALGFSTLRAASAADLPRR